jgi:hypothetical protein
MIKNLIRLFLFLFTIVFFNLVKAEDPACKLVGNAIDPAASYGTATLNGNDGTTFYTDKSCRVSGLSSEIFTMYKIGLCKSKPVIGCLGNNNTCNSDTISSTTDLTSCVWVFDNPNGQSVDVVNLSTSNLSNPVLPPTDTYTYAIFIANSIISSKSSVKFTERVVGANGTGTTCYTNGVTLTSAGEFAPFFGDTSKVTFRSLIDPYQDNLSFSITNLAADCTSSFSSNLMQLAKQDLQYFDIGRATTALTNTSRCTNIGCGNSTHAKAASGGEFYAVNDNLIQQAIPGSPPNNSNIGTTKIIGVIPNNINISNNVTKGNQTCTTSSLDLTTNVTNGAYVNMYHIDNSGNYIIADIKTAGFGFAFTAGTDICGPITTP